ncbi:MAG: Gfo/Idh/MocA family oxidoreductase [Deltaproteobacteria bacterium]|nr:Gfo/Idh/MocA family oxidoreductase [Deltaproteobacteria bacterium]
MHLVVIGSGSIGKRHLSNLHQLGVEKLSAVDIRSERLNEVSQTITNLQKFTDLNQALDQPNLDGAIICTPTCHHISVAQKVVERGLNCMMEKPLSHSLVGLEEVARELQDRGLWMMVAYSMRFHPGIVKLKTLLDERAVGHVLSVRAECGQYLPDWHPWEDYRGWYMSKEDQGGGAILDMSHEIDYLRWFFGDVEELTAVVTKVSDLDIDTDDLSEVILRFCSGLLGSLHLDLLQRVYRRTSTIIGTEGTITWDYNAHAVQLYTAGSGRWQTFEYAFDRNAYFIEELKHFLACLRGEAEPKVDFEDGRKTLKVVLAAKQSSRERRWVSV